MRQRFNTLATWAKYNCCNPLSMHTTSWIVNHNYHLIKGMSVHPIMGLFAWSCLWGAPLQDMLMRKTCFFSYGHRNCKTRGITSHPHGYGNKSLLKSKTLNALKNMLNAQQTSISCLKIGYVFIRHVFIFKP